MNALFCSSQGNATPGTMPLSLLTARSLLSSQHGDSAGVTMLVLGESLW
ncbi:hypothetical protein [Candidatus Electronema sp. PJ]